MTIGRPNKAANGQPTKALKAVKNIDKNLNIYKFLIIYNNHFSFK